MDNILLNIEEIKTQNSSSNNTSDKKNSKSDKISDIDYSKIPDIKNLQLSKKETFYFQIINKYHKTLPDVKRKIMVSIINGDSYISLRFLDWFITQYSSNHTVRYYIDVYLNDDILTQTKKPKITSGNSKKSASGVNKSIKLNSTDNKGIDDLFNVHISYKAQLRSFRKQYFDPFRRRKKFKYYFAHDKEKKHPLVTTIGQLNFFKWLFTKGVLHYVIYNYTVLYAEVTKHNEITKKNKIKKIKNSEDDSEEDDDSSEESEDSKDSEKSSKSNKSNKSNKKKTNVSTGSNHQEPVNVVLSFE